MAEVKQSISLIVEGSYQACSLGVASDNKLIRSVEYTNGRASAHLLSWIDELLSQESIDIESISSIIVNAGPGAFTSLRVAIVTLNALSFAKQIPIIGIDALKALAADAAKIGVTESSVIVPFLNAYAQEVYFALYDGQGNEISPATYKKIDTALEQIQKVAGNKHIHFIGNGCDVFAEKISSIASHYTCIKQAVPSLSSLLSEAQGIIKSSMYTHSYELYPLYLKSQTFAVR